MFDIRFEAFWVEAAEQRLASEISPRFFDTGKLLAAPQRAACRRQPVDETQALGRPDNRA